MKLKSSPNITSYDEKLLRSLKKFEKTSGCDCLGHKRRLSITFFASNLFQQINIYHLCLEKYLEQKSLNNVIATPLPFVLPWFQIILPPHFISNNFNLLRDERVS